MKYDYDPSADAKYDYDFSVFDGKYDDDDDELVLDIKIMKIKNLNYVRNYDDILSLISLNYMK